MYSGEFNSFDSEEVVSCLFKIDTLCDDLQTKKLLASKFQTNKYMFIFKELISIFFSFIFIIFIPLFLFSSNIMGSRKKFFFSRIFIPTENKRLKSNREIFEHDYFFNQKIVKWPSLPSLTLSDLKFIFRVFLKTKFQLGIFLVFFKTIFNVTRLRTLINLHNPDSICMFNEWDLITPTIHKYLNENNILFEILMHGDKAYELNDAYTSADFIYIWSLEYKKIFEDLRVKAKFKNIGFPRYFVFNVNSEEMVNEVIFIPPIKKNFFKEEKKIHIHSIKEFVSKVKPLIKLHPKHQKEQKKFLKLKSYNRLTSKLVFDKSSIVVGYVSTVLYRAAISGIDVKVINCIKTEQMSKYHPLFSMKNVSLVDFHEVNQIIRR